MVIEQITGEVINVPTNSISSILRDVGQTLLYLQALGVIVLLWIIFQLISLYWNKRKKQLLHEMNEKMHKIDKRLDRIEKAVIKKKK